MILDFSEIPLPLIISEVVDKCINYVTTLSRSIISKCTSMLSPISTQTIMEDSQTDIELEVFSGELQNTNYSVIEEVVPNEVLLNEFDIIKYDPLLEIVQSVTKIGIFNGYFVYKQKFIKPSLKYIKEPIFNVNVTDYNRELRSIPKVKMQFNVNTLSRLYHNILLLDKKLHIYKLSNFVIPMLLHTI